MPGRRHKAERVIIGGRLREAREALGLPLGEAAARLGFERSHLSRIERGDRTPDPVDVHTMLELYGGTLADLVAPFDAAEWQRHEDAKARRSRDRRK